jgi:hypothetical protein
VQVHCVSCPLMIKCVVLMSAIWVCRCSNVSMCSHGTSRTCVLCVLPAWHTECGGEHACCVTKGCHTPARCLLEYTVQLLPPCTTARAQDGGTVWTYLLHLEHVKAKI